MPHQYTVRSYTVAELLVGESGQYVVPEFQRSYSWRASEVEALIEDVLDDSDGRPTRYFLRAIVCVRREGELLVIDGQQRLATLSLLLATIRELMRERGDERDADVLSGALVTKQLGEAPVPRLALQPDDAERYQSLIDNPGRLDESKAGMGKIERAALTIRELLVARIARRPDSDGRELNEIAKRVFAGIELVRIDAADEGSAYRLFEALNDRGRALSAADLIKNKLFSRSRGYLPTVRTDWARVTRSVGADDLLHALRHYWIAFRDPVRRSELFDAYAREISVLVPEQVAGLTAELARATELYRDIMRPRRMATHSGLAPARDALTRLDQLRARTCRPLLLLVATRWPDGLGAVARMCEAATIRHTLVCRRSPSPLEKAYGAVCRDLRAAEGASTADALAVVSSGLGRWVPSDQDFQDALTTVAPRGRFTSWRLVLERPMEHETPVPARGAGCSHRRR